MDLVEQSLCILAQLVALSLNLPRCFSNQKAVTNITNAVIVPEDTTYTLTQHINLLNSTETITVCSPFMQHVNTQ